MWPPSGRAPDAEGGSSGRQRAGAPPPACGVHLGPIFKANGVHREALAALALFRKAADQEKATLDLAERLVAFLRKAQHDPDLKFQEEQE